MKNGHTILHKPDPHLARQIVDKIQAGGVSVSYLNEKTQNHLR